MPAYQIKTWIVLAFGAAVMSGCTSTEMKSAGIAPSATYAYNSEAAVQLPETMTVLPSSYAGPSLSSAPIQLAAVEPPSKDAARLALLPAQADPLVEEAPPDPETSTVRASGEVRPRIDTLISKYAALYEVPEALVRRVVKRESNFLPNAYNRGHWGLMQIKHATARGMGYLGSAKGLLDAETNLKFSVKYLRGAWLVSQGDPERADRLYQRGYYYDAKRMGLLDETGLGRDHRRTRL